MMDFHTINSVWLFLHFIWTIISCCKVPPALWCDDAGIAEQCNVLEQCSTYNHSVYKHRVKLTVVYEALCPGCEEFIAITLYNVTWWQWEAWKFIDLELIPYGNAHSVFNDDGSYTITCQHGPDECWMNKLHSCVMEVLGEANIWLPVISCMEEKSHKAGIARTAEHCLKWPLVQDRHRHLIWACQNGTYGDELQKKAADRTDSLSPDPHSRVPWIVVNGVSLRSIQYLAEYGHREPILYYALRNWFRGGRDPQMNRLGAKPVILEEKQNVKVQDKSNLLDGGIPVHPRRCLTAQCW